MKNIAIILAGGIGSRMGADVPKQFLMIENKPVIIHTLEKFSKHDDIDSILVVCESNWITYLEKLIDIYKTEKVKWIIPGGDTGHNSTRNALFFLKEYIDKDDFVIIHDAARPILPKIAIDEMLKIAHKKGNASLAIPCHETVIYTEDQVSGNKELDRNKLMRVQTPQAYRYSLILPWYEKAEEENKHDFVYADIVGVYYGARIYFSQGFINNIKITRKEDIVLCKALLHMKDEQLYSK